MKPSISWHFHGFRVSFQIIGTMWWNRGALHQPVDWLIDISAWLDPIEGREAGEVDPRLLIGAERVPQGAVRCCVTTLIHSMPRIT